MDSILWVVKLILRTQFLNASQNIRRDFCLILNSCSEYEPMRGSGTFPEFIPRIQFALRRFKFRKPAAFLFQ